MAQKFAVFDIDGTLFRSGLHQEVFYELIKMGVMPSEASEKTTEKHRQWRHRLHGNAFEEFEQSLVGYIDNHLPKLKIADYETAAERVLKKKAENVYVYTRNLLQSLKEQGYFTIAISGSQEILVEPFAQRYGFDAWVGQHWSKGDEFFTGESVKTHTGKDKILQKFIDKYDLTLEDSYAVGDSNGDVGMLSIVANPIAFNPTFELAEKARTNGWTIVVERKNVSYELRKDEASGEYMLRGAEHL